jgi:hypothetical protein
VGDRRYVATMEAALAGVRALRGDPDGAEEDLARVEVQLAVHGRANLARLADVYRSIAGIVRGDRAPAHALAAELAGAPVEDVRLALPLLRRVLREADEDARTWTFDARGTGFRPPGGEDVSLETRLPLARILAALARQRVEHAGEPLDKVDLARSAWPDESRLQVTAANNRLKVAISTLRKLGIEPILMTRGGGYLLDPSVPIRIAVENLPI